MKNRPSFKVALCQLALLVASCIGTSSCTNPTPQVAGNTDDSAKAVNEEKFNTNNAQDAQFLVNTVGINLQEIQLGQLAQQNGTLPAVKELGKMMVDEHTKSLGELTALAKTKRIAIPTSVSDTAQDAYNKLKTTVGTAFDKAYCRNMIDGHRALIDVFDKEAKEAVDKDIKQWVTTTLPELRTHLNHAVSCEKKLLAGKR